jgi:NAD(P)-dependent dehydrogenase (short-subunit alcohol dehydrogenase family)
MVPEAASHLKHEILVGGLSNTIFNGLIAWLLLRHGTALQWTGENSFVVDMLATALLLPFIVALIVIPLQRNKLKKDKLPAIHLGEDSMVQSLAGRPPDHCATDTAGYLPAGHRGIFTGRLRPVQGCLGGTHGGPAGCSHGSGGIASRHDTATHLTSDGLIQAIGPARRFAMGLLENKIGVVTGAGQGIGRAIALSFAREGARVVVADFNEAMGRETTALIHEVGGDATFVFGDVSKENSVREMIDKVRENYGRLDIACNSAALSRGSGPIHQYERDVFDQTLEMCLTNTWLCMKYEIAAMLETGGGAIVNISSNASLRGQPFNTAYAAAKGGVNIMTKSAAGEYGSKGIRINAVSPGVIRTPGIEKYMEEQPRAAEALVKRPVMKRLGEPGEIAEAVSFLCSDRASYITGQVLSVDGGEAVK